MVYTFLLCVRGHPSTWLKTRREPGRGESYTEKYTQLGQFVSLPVGFAVTRGRQRRRVDSVCVPLAKKLKRLREERKSVVTASSHFEYRMLCFPSTTALQNAGHGRRRCDLGFFQRVVFYEIVLSYALLVRVRLGQ
jgi:hypothetical protein